MGHKPWDMPWRRAERRRAKQAWRDDVERIVSDDGTLTVTNVYMKTTGTLDVSSAFDGSTPMLDL